MNNSHKLTAVLQKAALFGIGIMVAVMYFLVPVEVSSRITPFDQKPEVVRESKVVEPKTIAAVDTQKLKETLASHNYHFHNLVTGGKPVPRVHCLKIPADFKNLKCIYTKKSLFIQVLLPMVLQINEMISAERAKLLDIKVKMDEGNLLTAKENLWLQELSEKYKLRTPDVDELVSRVDSIPISQALGQAIIESGWGQSYAARVKNSVFGMTISDKVKPYENLFESTFSYIHNLNTNHAYREMRRKRRALRAEGKSLDGHILIGELRRYSEQGSVYIHKVRNAIRINDLAKLDDLELEPLL